MARNLLQETAGVRGVKGSHRRVRLGADLGVGTLALGEWRRRPRPTRRGAVGGGGSSRVPAETGSSASARFVPARTCCLEGHSAGWSCDHWKFCKNKAHTPGLGKQASKGSSKRAPCPIALLLQPSEKCLGRCR